MADNVLATWQPFLYELQGQVVAVFPTEAPMLAELSGVGDPSSVGRFTRDMDGNRTIFSGKQVRHTIITAMLPGGGNVTETQTWNVPQLLPSSEVHINLVRSLVPFSVSVDVERDSFDNSAAVAVATMVDQTRIALARLENYQILGDGTGLMGTVASASGSPGLTVPMAAGTNYDIILPGTVWDVLTRSTGADAGNGLRRKVASVNESTGNVVFDTNATATDGGSGNITFSGNSGLYIPGSWSNGTTTQAPGALCAQGLEQIAATSGTFEALDKGAVQTWQGTDGRGGDTSSLALTDQMLDGAVRRGRRAGIGVWDFGIGDPACIDLWKQGHYAAVRYGSDTVTLASGFSGTVYEGADKPFPLIKEPAHKKLGIKLVEKKSLQLYGDQKGPSFLEDDGAMFRRFTRQLVKEADMLDRWQLGAIKCNTLVFLNNLQAAA